MGGSSGTLATLGSADTLNGAGGTDTLTATLTGGTTTPTLTSIENLSIQNTSAVSTLDLINSTGYTSLTSAGTTGGVLTFANINTTAAALALSNTALGATFTHVASVVAGTSDSEDVTLTNVTNAAVVTIASVETLALTSSGTTANSIDLQAANATTVTVRGSNALTLAGVAAATTINGSTMTLGLTTTLAVAGSLTGGSGNDSLTGSAGNDVLVGNAGNNTITAAAGTDSITAGAGNDRIVFATATNLTVLDSVDAGAGTNTLAVTAADIDTNEALADTADLTALTRLANIQVVEVLTAIGTATTDADINVVRMAPSITTVTTGIAQTNTTAAVYTFNTGASTLNLGVAGVSAALAASGNTFVASGTGTADSLTINKTNTNAEAVMATSALTITGFETINIGSGALAGGAQTTGAIGWTPTTANAAVTLNVTGSAPQAIGVITPAGDNLVTINGSGMTAQAAGTTTLTTVAPVASATGTVSIVGSEGQDVLIGDVDSRNTIIGGGGIDTITGGSANDSLSGGAGNDSITAAAGNDTVLGGDNDDRIVFATAGDLTVADSIDGGTGTNTLSVSAADVDTNEALVDSADIASTGRISNIQAVEVTGIGAGATSNDINVARVASSITTVNTVAVTGGTAAVFTFNTGASTLNMGSAATLVALGAGATLAAAGTGTADSLTINRVGTAAEAILGTRALTVSGIETITVNTGSVTNTAQTTGPIGWTPTTTNATVTLNVTGANQLTTGVITPAGNNQVVINASGMTAQAAGTSTLITVAPVASATGTVSIVGSAGQDVLIGDIDSRNTITGGAGVDTITGGSAADNLSGEDGIDSITGGGGNDIISGGTGNDLIVETVTAADTINIDGGANNDTLTLTGFDTLTGDDTLTGGTDIDTLSIAAANTTVGGAAGVTGWEILSVTAAIAQSMTTVFSTDTTITRADFTGGNGASGIASASAILNTLRTTSNNNTLSFARAVNTTSDVLTYGPATNAAATLAVLTVNGEETLNIGQGAITTTANTSTISSLNAIQATTINITGASPMVVTAVGTSASATGFGTTARSIVINAGDATNTVIFAAGTALATQPLTMTGSRSAASTLTGGIGADSITGGTGDDSLTGGNSADTIDGGFGADSLLGGTGADSITAGEGVDVITPGQGNDTVILTESTAAIDNVILETASTNGVDTIIGFASGAGVDTVTFQTADTTVATAAGAAAFETITPTLVTAATYNLGAANATTAAAMDVYEFIGANEANGDLSLVTNGTELLKLLGTQDSAATSITTEANGDAYYIIAYDNGNAYMYLASAGADAITTALEITLVAVFNSTTAGNFAAGDILTVG